MNLINGILTQGRALAVSRMSETVHAGSSTTTTDPVTGQPVQSGTTVYDGAARLKFASTVVSDKATGGQLVSSQNVELHCPSGTKIPIGTVVTVTASTADDSLVGRKFKVTGRPEAGQTTAARFQVVEQ